MDTDVLDWALVDFSGDVAADAVYDGPCCMLAAVDKRCDKRLLSEVVDHDPTHEDIRALLGRLTTAVVARDVTLFGVTTEGASRSPEPLVEVCGEVPQHICQLHIVADVVNAVWGAVASARTCLAATHPTWPKGRPSTQAAQTAARKKKRLDEPRTDVCTQRSLLVHHPLRTRDRQTLWRLTRGLPQWRTLRARMEQGYAWVDRRCRTQSAVASLATLRRRLRRFHQWGETRKKLFSPTVEKALTLLDDTLLPSTSHAVERGNRRYRTMQKHVYRVRTHAQISARLALDMWREAQGEGRHQTLASLHHARAG